MHDIVLISVIVPTYNGGQYLDSCLSALRHCLYVPYEIMVIDNGSVDHSRKIAHDHGVGIVDCPEPSGPGAARNQGARYAKGEILLFVDADVVIQSDALLRVLAAFQEHEDLAAVFGSYDNQPAAQNFISQYKNLLNHFVHQHSNTEAETFWGGCGAIRADVFHRIGGFNETTYPQASIEDIEMGYRLRRAGYRIVLDKDLQGQHLKEWRFFSLIRTDIFCRAIPWTKLILESRNVVNALNLQRSQRVSVGMVGMAAMVSLLTVVEPSMSLTALPFLFVALFLNRQLFHFFLRARGFRFAVAALPLQLLYFFYSGVIFATYWACNCCHTRSANLYLRLTKWRNFFSRTSVPKNPLETTLPDGYNLGDGSSATLSSAPLPAISSSQTRMGKKLLRPPSKVFSSGTIPY